jgi:hypothetical protein
MRPPASSRPLFISVRSLHFSLGHFYGECVWTSKRHRPNHALERRRPTTGRAAQLEPLAGRDWGNCETNDGAVLGHTATWIIVCRSLCFVEWGSVFVKLVEFEAVEPIRLVWLFTGLAGWVTVVYFVAREKGRSFVWVLAVFFIAPLLFVLLLLPYATRRRVVLESRRIETA